MPEDKNVNISVVPKFAETALENVLDKPSKSIGDTFNDIWYLIFGSHIGLASEKRKIKYALELEKYKKEIENSIISIPEEKRCEPDMQLVGQALEASQYCIEKTELRKMFVKLLHSSIDEDKQGEIHPSYSTIIKELSSDEAILLAYLSKSDYIQNNRFPIVDIRHIITNSFIEDVNGTNIIKNVNHSNNKIKTIYTSQKSDSFELGNIILNNQSNIGDVAGCNEPNRVAEYLFNFQRLRLIDIRDRQIVDAEVYEKVINSKYVEKMIMNYQDDVFIDKINFCFLKKYFCFTEYGLNFLGTCIM